MNWVGKVATDSGFLAVRDVCYKRRIKEQPKERKANDRKQTLIRKQKSGEQRNQKRNNL